MTKEKALEELARIGALDSRLLSWARAIVGSPNASDEDRDQVVALATDIAAKTVQLQQMIAQIGGRTATS
ncbi:hypothetical protein KW786_00805 [Candidatus Parcubacteria bacterium]|nr:hypothetical protein [Candidatus Parcubacteria bacterium]